MSEIILMRVTSNDRLIFVVETRDLNKSRKTDKMKRRKNVKTKTPKKPNKQTKKKKKNQPKNPHERNTCLLVKGDKRRRVILCSSGSGKNQGIPATENLCLP